MKLESGKPSAFQNYRISCVSWTRKKMSSCRTWRGVTRPTSRSWKKPSARCGNRIKAGLPVTEGRCRTRVQTSSKGHFPEGCSLALWCEGLPLFVSRCSSPNVVTQHPVPSTPSVRGGASLFCYSTAVLPPSKLWIWPHREHWRLLWSMDSGFLQISFGYFNYVMMLSFRDVQMTFLFYSLTRNLSE